MIWYYADGSERRGPVTEAEFATLVAQGTIRRDTLVWHEGLPEWQEYGRFASPELSPLPPLSSISRPSRPPVRYAGFWIRFVAKFMDGLILGLASMVVRVPLMAAQFASENPRESIAFSLLDAVAALVMIAAAGLYHIFFVGARGATPGKMLLGLKIVRADGSPVSYALATGRWFAAALNYFTLYIGWIIVGFDSQKRGLHDRICETRVIHDR